MDNIMGLLCGLIIGGGVGFSYGKMCAMQKVYEFTASILEGLSKPMYSMDTEKDGRIMVYKGEHIRKWVDLVKDGMNDSQN